mgnify:FL=1
MNQQIQKMILKIIIILLLSTLLLNGCVGQKELNNLGIVNLMGIDLINNGKYKISLHIIKPSTGQGGQPASAPGPGSAIWIGEAKGNTIQEAVRNIRKKTSWILTWSHCDIIIVGKDLCKRGLGPVVDYLARDMEIRLTSNLLTTTGKAWHILRHSSEEKKEPVSDQIDGLINNIQDWSMAYNLNLKETLARLVSKKQELVIGKLNLTAAGPVKKGQELLSQKSSQEALKLVLEMKGATIFQKDKWIGVLNETETRGFMRLLNQIKIHTMNIKLDNSNSLISLDTYKTNTKIKWMEQKALDQVNIKVQESCKITEQNSGLDLTDPELIEKIENNKEKAVKNETRRVLSKIQQLNTDILGLKDIMDKQNSDLFKKINNKNESIITNLKFNIIVNSIITQPGKIRKSILK